MDFVSNGKQQVREMLASLGLSSVEELFCDIPKSLRVDAPVNDDGLSEYEGMKFLESIANKNRYDEVDNYLGAGAYDHHVPAIVDAICSKSEFLTAYTPYQPEVSQGTLQAIFEFQSAICALTGLDVANASLYDGASACAEGVLMALRHHKKRNRIVIAKSVHPHYRSVISTYLRGLEVEIVEVAEDFERAIDDNTAGVLTAFPNFFGVVEDLSAISATAKKMGALSIICGNPLAYGLFKSPKEMGADIAVGDGQVFGLPLNFGGPFIGTIACCQKLVRQIPGRIVGETVDTNGKRGFVLTLQAREQHIRRDKATSNICSNQTLASVAMLVALLWYGKEGTKQLALTNFQRANYLKEQLASIPGCSVDRETTTFNEFVVSFDKDLKEVITAFRNKNIEPGVDLGRFYPQRKNQLLVAVTETKNKQQLDRYIHVVRGLS